MVLKSSHKEMKADVNPEGEIFIVMQTEKAPNKIEGYLYVY
jgi:hypothetical protein